jgi:hypothetical protein
MVQRHRLLCNQRFLEVAGPGLELKDTVIFSHVRAIHGCFRSSKNRLSRPSSHVLHCWVLLFVLPDYCQKRLLVA